MALLPLASGNEAREFWARTVEFSKALGASQVTEFCLGKCVDGPGGVIGQTAHTPFLCSGVILGRIEGFHARSIPPDTLKQKLWVTGSPSRGGPHLPAQRGHRGVELEPTHFRTKGLL